ncbi:metallophosphoesterase [Halalkalibacillus halophilus]|uniref:metallophosphoesterase n=1 Tax=Halalkalibacillus halophilus TaxID=392827 RepID=UPI000489D392|nr:metallophosphoesterase [Halalkalibacillus halophilus]
MTQPFTFIHCADLHLDSPYKGLYDLPSTVFGDLKVSTFKSYSKLINLAIDQSVDFVLMVGDVFDQQAASLHSLMKWVEGLEELAKHDIKCYVSFGNHDYDLLSKVKLQLPENTFVFKEEKIDTYTFEKKGEFIAEISGFSYQSRAITKNKTKEFPNVKKPDIFQIAMLHGNLESAGEHANYAPFQLSDLKALPFNYWALGHIHKRETLEHDPPVTYPGNIQGRHMKETGEKGCYVVQVTNGNPVVEFHPLQEIQFQEKKVTITDWSSVNELIKQLSEQKEEIRKQIGKSFLRLYVTLKQPPEQLEEIIKIINEQEMDRDDWVWVEKLIFKEHLTYDRERLKQSNPFINELLNELDSTSGMKEDMHDLLSHRVYSKYYSNFHEEEQEEVKDQAEKLILEELIKGESN